jgi:hypothetical protein
MGINRRHILTAVALGALLLSGAVVWAQSAFDDVVLHEYFNPWDVDVSRSAGSPGAAQAEPSANEARRAPGEPPGLSVDPGADEVILGADGPVDPAKTTTPYGPLDPRQQSSKLDDRTDRVDELNYYANFEPSVVPYKRGVVQNLVRFGGGDYSLALQPGRTRRVPVEGGSLRSGEDEFWGSFLLRANEGERHPLPSVAPTQRILEVQAEPNVGVRFERDAADNFYIVPEAGGLLRLNVRLAAPGAYFGGDFSENVNWSQFDSSKTPELPREVAKVASEVLSGLGVSRQMRPHDALHRLVEHYRDFEGRPFPPELRGEDLYASLSREQVGVCRHRSLAFLISARALGIPTRYIYNEAHAFVEVDWPKLGWRRIDLGGAANELNYSAQAGSSVHSAGDDSLPQPPNYQEEIERLRERGGEVGEESGEESSEETSAAGEGESEQAGQSDQADQAGSTEDGAYQHQNEGGEQQTPGQGEEPGESELAANEELDQSLPIDDASQEDTRRKVILDANADTSEVFRGNSLGLNGSLFTEQGRPLSKRQIQVYLGPVGSKSADARIELGTLRTDAGGRFSGQLAIPDSVSIGRWSVILEFAGDDEHRSARAE